MIYDVIVVGAGPGGSSTATFLARRGVTTLLLDKSSFPRDKVCGDGLTPQAIYWLERLGAWTRCSPPPTAASRAATSTSTASSRLTGSFPDEPDLSRTSRSCWTATASTTSCCGTRCRCGAQFAGDRLVRRSSGRRTAYASRPSTRAAVEYRGRIVIGADGVSSTVSRAIGNTFKDGVTAVSVRTYLPRLSMRRRADQGLLRPRLFPRLRLAVRR